MLCLHIQILKLTDNPIPSSHTSLILFRPSLDQSPKQVFLQSTESESEVQSCPTLCDPMECSPPGSSLHGILQARVLEWVAISFSRGSSRPKDRTQVSRIPGRHFNLWATREAQLLGCKLCWCCLPLYPYPIYNHHFRNILTTRPRHSRFDCLHYSLSHGSANYQIPCFCCINLCWVERIIDPLAFPWWWRSLSISLYLFRITKWLKSFRAQRDWRDATSLNLNWAVPVNAKFYGRFP